MYVVVLDEAKRLLVVAEELLEPLQERFWKLEVVDRLDGALSVMSSCSP